MTIELNPEALRELRYREFLERSYKTANELALEIFSVSNEDPQVPPEDFLSFTIDFFCRMQVEATEEMQRMLTAATPTGTIRAQDFKDKMLNLASAAMAVVSAIEVPVAEFRESNQLKH